MATFQLPNTLFGKSDQQQSTPDGQPTIDSDLRRTSLFLGAVALIGVLAVALWASRRGSDLWLSTCALGLMLLGGTALVGGVLGLLFGIPKSVSDPAAAAPPPTNPGAAGAEGSANNAPRSSYTVNTNLEQISDWLTKIIVGVGLTQIGTIRTQFQDMAAWFGNGFASPTSTPPVAAEPVVAAVIIIYGLTAGFLAGYLLTRMFLPGAFIRADEVLRRRNTQLVTQLARERQSTEAAGRMQGEIYNDLYRYKEQGFRDAIRKIEEFLKSSEQRRNPALWVYLAAAHGQAWRWENQNRPDSDPDKKKILQQHRDAALGAVNNALALGDDWKPILQLMWNKEHPAKSEGTGKEEDDLEVFYDDPEFRRLLGD